MKRCLVIVFMLLGACSKEDPQSEIVRPVLSITIKPQTMRSLGRYAGHIQARYESTLGFRISGRVAQRLLDVGALVCPGELLATLDPIDQQNRLRSSQGDTARVNAQFVNAQADARRQQELFDHGVGAQATLDAAVADLKSAEASRLQAKAAEAQARHRVGYSELYAEHASVITQWHIEAGQVVTAGQPAVVLARPDIKEAVIDLPSDLAGQLTQDVQFDVYDELNPDVHTKAIVREVEPEAESTTRTRKARLTLTQTPSSFRLGTSVYVNVTFTLKPQFTLPVTALQQIGGQSRIWIIDPASHTVFPRVIKVVSHTTASIIVADGVEDGEQVVTAGVNSLTPGQKVSINKENY